MGGALMQNDALNGQKIAAAAVFGVAWPSYLVKHGHL